MSHMSITGEESGDKQGIAVDNLPESAADALYENIQHALAE